jgi:predicted nuclease with TOPRIM domain
MLITFVLGCACIWMFLSICEIRYMRKLMEGLKIDEARQGLVSALQDKNTILEEEIEELKEQVQGSRHAEERLDHLHKLLDDKADKLRDMHIQQAKLECELTKTKGSWDWKKEELPMVNICGQQK